MLIVSPSKHLADILRDFKALCVHRSISDYINIIRVLQSCTTKMQPMSNHNTKLFSGYNQRKKSLKALSVHTIYKLVALVFLLHRTLDHQLNYY